MALRIGGDADRFAHVQAVRHFEEVHGFERNLRGRGLRLGRRAAALGERRTCGDEQARGEAGCETSDHFALLVAPKVTVKKDFCAREISHIAGTK